MPRLASGGAGDGLMAETHHPRGALTSSAALDTPTGGGTAPLRLSNCKSVKQCVRDVAVAGASRGMSGDDQSVNHFDLFEHGQASLRSLRTPCLRRDGHAFSRRCAAWHGAGGVFPGALPGTR